MVKATFNFIPPSMESTASIMEDVDVKGTGQEQLTNTGQALADHLPLNEEFSLLHWCPPDQRESRERILPQLRSGEKKLQREKNQLGKQYT